MKREMVSAEATCPSMVCEASGAERSPVCCAGMGDAAQSLHPEGTGTVLRL